MPPLARYAQFAFKVRAPKERPQLGVRRGEDDQAGQTAGLVPDRAEQELKRQYLTRSLYGAEVVTTITPIERNRVNVTFTVREGDVAKIKEIHIVGNHAFDESTLLSPDGTVALFQLINERGGTSTSAAAKFGEGLRCVTCGEGMKLTHDQVKGTRFSYQACRKGHGRLTTFHNFLAEKQFVRELTKAERAKLSATVGQIRCSGCGAAVNIGKVDACEYCRAPVSVFDRDAAKKALENRGGGGYSKMYIDKFNQRADAIVKDCENTLARHGAAKNNPPQS